MKKRVESRSKCIKGIGMKTNFKTGEFEFRKLLIQGLKLMGVSSSLILLMLDENKNTNIYS
jgi:hypothetical protein